MISAAFSMISARLSGSMSDQIPLSKAFLAALLNAWAVMATCALADLAACLAAVNPDCFEAIFGTRDAEALRDRFAAWLELDRGDHAAAAAEFESWAARPVAQIAAWPAMRTTLLRLLQPVKRRCFREGFISGFHLRFDASWGERLALGHSFP